MDRIILHYDLNCFYASVELLSHPELREVPVAVAGDPASRHGIILAKNEPAKQCGVKTAETIWQAKKKCPNLVLLPAHHKLYREYSNKVNAIYDEYTDLAESFGIDESWLDVTNTLHLFGGDAKALANAIRQRVKRELGLTLSVGVSFNKVFAKLGSDYKKPDATTVITTTLMEVIASISMDHTDLLGDTLAKIAAQKAGIIKPDTMVVSAQQKSEAAQVIENTYKEQHCTLQMVDESKISNVHYGAEGQTFSLSLIHI